MAVAGNGRGGNTDIFTQLLSAIRRDQQVGSLAVDQSLPRSDLAAQTSSGGFLQWIRDLFRYWYTMIAVAVNRWLLRVDAGEPSGASAPPRAISAAEWRSGRTERKESSSVPQQQDREPPVGSVAWIVLNAAVRRKTQELDRARRRIVRLERALKKLLRGGQGQ